MDVPNTGIINDVLWADLDEDIAGWAENDRGVSFTFRPDMVTSFLQKQDMNWWCERIRLSKMITSSAPSNT